MCDVFREAQLIYSAVRNGLIESMWQIYSVTLMFGYLMFSEFGFHSRGAGPLCERVRENARLEIEILAVH